MYHRRIFKNWMNQISSSLGPPLLCSSFKFLKQILTECHLWWVGHCICHGETHTKHDELHETDQQPSHLRLSLGVNMFLSGTSQTKEFFFKSTSLFPLMTYLFNFIIKVLNYLGGVKYKSLKSVVPWEREGSQAPGFLCLGSPQLVFSSNDDIKENEFSPFIFLLFLQHEARGP